MGRGRELARGEYSAYRPVLQRVRGHGGAVQRVWWRAGQRFVVRPQPTQGARHNECHVVHVQRRRRVRNGARSSESGRHLRRVAGRQHRTLHEVHRRAGVAGETDVAATLHAVGGFDPRLPARHYQADDVRREAALGRDARQAAQGLQRPRHALELEHPVLHLGAQSPDVVLRRQSRPQVHEAGRRDVSHLAGPVLRGYDESARIHENDGRNHRGRDRRGDVRHDCLAQRVARQVRHSHGGHGRWSCVDHVDRRRQLDRAHAQREGCAGGHLRLAHRALALRLTHVLRDVRQSPAGRLQAVRLRDQ